jgi:hypothetical protein
LTGLFNTKINEKINKKFLSGTHLLILICLALFSL